MLSLGAPLLAVIAIAATVALAALGAAALRLIVRHHVGEAHNEVLVPLFLTAGTMYAVLLGFMVIVVWEAYGGAHDNVAEEAATLVPLYRETEGLQPTEGDKFRALIRAYARAVIENEWPLQAANGGDSSIAGKALGDIFREFRVIDPATKALDAQMHGQFLTTLGQVVALSNKRLVQANERVPWVIWLAAVGGGGVVLSMSFLLFMERAGPQIVMTGILGIMIGALLFIMLMLSDPFGGPLALSSEPFETALHVFDDIDKGN